MFPHKNGCRIISIFMQLLNSDNNIILKLYSPSSKIIKDELNFEFSVCLYKFNAQVNFITIN